MVTHTFKSAEMKKKFTDTVASMKMEDIVKSMKSDNAACQMTWNTPGDTMEMYCWWKGKDEQDRKSTRLNSSHSQQSRMPSSA